MGAQQKAAIVFCLILIASGPLVATASQTLQNGKAAFQNKNYSAALEYFLAAEQDAKQHPSVQYNIAVCFYRLARYNEAKGRFEQLAKLDQWENLAQYNLGLVAQAQGKHTEAQHWYGLSAEAEHEKIRLLSRAKLKNYEQNSQAKTESPRAAGRAYAGLLGLKFGEDSNAASLADDLINDNAFAEDRFSELLAYGQGYINGEKNNGLKLYGLGFFRQYNEFDQLNSRVLGVGVSREATIANGTFDLGLRVTQTSVDGNHLSSQLQGSIGVGRSISEHRFTLSYLPSRYFADAAYSHIEGAQHRLQGEWQKRFAQVNLKARYRYEINDRDDLNRNGSIVNYSPTRNTVELQVAWDVYEDLQLTLGWAEISSQYEGKNRQRDIMGDIKEQQRNNEQRKINIAMQYKFSKQIRVGGEYHYIDSDDTYELYAYQKHTLSAGVSYQF